LAWLPYKQRYLQVLLDMEAPPHPRVCMLCQGDGTYRCAECIHRPLLCSSCCRKEHKLRPFHRVDQWNGTFFEESSLRLVSHQFYVAYSNNSFRRLGWWYTSAMVGICVRMAGWMVRTLLVMLRMNERIFRTNQDHIIFLEERTGLA